MMNRRKNREHCRHRRKKKDETITGQLPAKVLVFRGNLVFVETEGLPSAMLNRLHRLPKILAHWPKRRSVTLSSLRGCANAGRVRIYLEMLRAVP